MIKLLSEYKNYIEAFHAFIADSKTLQYVIELFFIMVAVSHAFRGFWKTSYVYWYAGIGLLSMIMLIFVVLVGRMYRYNDVILLLFFLVLAWFSSAIIYGITLLFFTSKFFCIWMTFLALYMVIRFVPDPSHALCVFSYALAIPFTGICLYALIHGGRSLFIDPPGQDLLLGCFRFGRLFALTNANQIGLLSSSLILVSVYVFLSTKKRRRFFFLFSAIIGWFTLGLSGCRTGMIGVSAAFGLIACSIFFLHKGIWQSWHILLRLACALLIGVAIGVLVLESFYLPAVIFRGILLGLNWIIRNPYLKKNVADLSARKVSDDDGTLTDRVYIWATCVKDCFRSLRRALLGISSLSKERVNGIYTGHHEITAPNAHNVYLDVVRRFGLLGLIPWVGLLVIWVRRGIQMLFKNGAGIADRFLATCAAGMLVMGMAEAVPISDLGPASVTIPFFIICGYCMIETRNKA